LKGLAIVKTFFWITLGLAALLSGCNTVKGVGQDVQKAGSVLENAAKR
jgi:predicted small secreted protein